MPMDAIEQIISDAVHAAENPPEPEGGDPTPEVTPDPEPVADPPVATGDVTLPTVDPAAPPVEPKVEPVVEDAFAKEHGITLDKDGRKNRLPYERVKEINENSLKKEYKELTGQDVPTGQTARQAFAAHKTHVSTLETEHRQQRDDLTRINAVGDLIDNNLPKFFEVLVQMNPKAKEFLKNAPGAAPVAQPQQTAFPDPDVEYDLGNGQKGKTYSADAIAKWGQALVAQTEQRVLAQVDQRVKPLTEAQQREAYVRDVVVPAMQKKAADARANWPGFKDHEPAIIKYIGDAQKAGRAVTLELAYAMVMNDVSKAALEKATTDEAKMRAKVLAEIKAAPKATSITPSAANQVVLPEDTGDPVENAIRKSIAGLKRT